MPTQVAIPTTPPAETPTAGQPRTAVQGTDRQQRARIDPSIATPGEKLSPLQTALQHVSTTTASLQPGLSNLLQEKGKEITSLRHRIHQKEFSLKKLEDDAEKVPRSARVKFELTAPSNVQDEAEFKELQEQTKSINIEYQQKLKANIIKALKLVIRAMKVNLAEEYARALAQIISIYHVAQGVAPDRNHPTALKLINEHKDAILKHIECENFETTYIKINNVDNLTPETRLLVNDRALEIARAIELIFVRSWDHYLAAHKDHQLVLGLQRHAKEIILQEKTAAAAEIIDQELPTSREQLQELIAKQVQVATAKIHNKAKAKAITKAKNLKRGPKGALPNKSTKQNGRRGRTTEQNEQGRTRGARSKSNGRSNGKSTKKKQASNNKKNKSSKTQNTK